MTSDDDFGSQSWLDEVFASPPARTVKGRTRWTHRHASSVEHLNRIAYVESRNELIGLLGLDYIHRRGQLRRFKEQPFTTPLSVFGYEYTPDFCAEDQRGAVYVAEVKTARFVTAAMERELEQRKQQFAAFGLKYVVWTDKAPLIRPLRHNLLRMRRASTEWIAGDEVERLVETLNTEGPLPLSVLYQQDLDIDLVAFAAWHGKVFFPLRADLGADTKIALQPSEDLATTLFSSEPDTQAWWNTLEAAV